MHAPRVLLYEPDDVASELHAAALRRAGHEVDGERDLERALAIAQRKKPDVLVAAITPGTITAAELVPRLALAAPHCALVCVVSRHAAEDPLRAVLAGATEALAAPTGGEALALAVARAAELATLHRRDPGLFDGARILSAARRIQRASGETSVARALLHACGAGVAVVPAAPAGPAGPAAPAGPAGPAAPAGPAGPAGNLASLVAQTVDDKTARKMLGRWPLAALRRAAPARGDVHVSREGPETVVRAGERLYCVVAGHPAPRELATYATQALFALRLGERFPGGASEPSIDPLTELPDEPWLLRRLGQELARHDPVSLVVVDLDGFRRLNEQHGHAAGGKVMSEAARLLLRQVRDRDLVARTGADEFALLLCGSGADAAQRVVARVREAFHRHRFLSREGLALAVSVAAGIATGEVAAAELLTRARAAAARARQEGGVALAPEA